MTRRGDAADRDGDRDRPGPGRHHVVADAREHPLGRNRHVVGHAVAQHQAEFVAGETAERVLAAHPGAHAFPHFADHFVGDVETIGFIDARQIVDRNQKKAAGGAETHRLVDRVFENFGEPVPVQFAGQPIAAREVRQLALVLMTFIDDAEHAARAPAAHRGRQTSVRYPRPKVVFPSQDRGGCRIESDRRRRARRRACQIA